jgi:uncharacterized protein YndB with AHSA1/START domain
MRSTRVSHRVNAPRSMVYPALLDARAVATWMVHTGIAARFPENARTAGSPFALDMRDLLPIRIKKDLHLTRTTEEC